MAERIAIIGTGIAGMGAAHLLHRHADLTIYEKNTYIGGHTNTVLADEDGVEVPIDTGFMVYNAVTYPNLVRLFAELDVPVKKTSMSFSVQHLPTGLEWNGASLNQLFAQRLNLLRPSYYSFLVEINRFNREAPGLLDDPSRFHLSLADYITLEGYSQGFVDKYLVPMSSAVWSTPPDKMLGFPAATLIRFFKNHGMLGMNTQFQWWTVDGGSRVYREKLIAPFRERIRTANPAVRVERRGGKAQVTSADGRTETFDKVVLASHADESLGMLSDATPLERELLSPFSYQNNLATLHTDEGVMPRSRRAWASWNYRVSVDRLGGLLPSTVYWMNSLQDVSKKRNYFVSINGGSEIDPSRVLLRIDYTHPVFTVRAMEAQKRLMELNGNGVTFFCGSYFRYGFHEDALTSAIDMVRAMTGEKVW